MGKIRQRIKRGFGKRRSKNESFFFDHARTEKTFLLQEGNKKKKDKESKVKSTIVVQSKKDNSGGSDSEEWENPGKTIDNRDHFSCTSCEEVTCSET